MLHAAAMLAGFFVIWLLLAQRLGGLADVALAGVVAAACVAVAARFGGVSAAFARAPGLVWLALARSGEVARGALATLRAAAAADVTLKPALVRVRTRADSVEARAAFADMLSASPGMAVVETEADGFLVHALDEDAVDAADLGRLEQAVIGAAGGGAQP